MSRKGNCWNNGVAEIFLTTTLKKELVHRYEFTSRRQAIEYIEAFYTPAHRHSHLGYTIPAEFGYAATVL